MTHITQNSIIYTKKLISYISAFLKRVLDGVIEARTRSANYKVAEQIWRTEYRSHSFVDVLAAVNKGDLDALRSDK